MPMRRVKRSSWESGKAKVPDRSVGFWVAITKNGSGRACVAAPIRAVIASGLRGSSLFGQRRLR